VAGNNAVKPTDPTKKGFIFKGGYLNGTLYDFNTPVNKNIILIAKWEITDNTVAVANNNEKVKKKYYETIYSAVSVNKDNKSVSRNVELSIPNDLKEYSNIKINSVTYIRNIYNSNDIQTLLGNNTDGYTWIIDNFGTVDNIEINKGNDYTTSWSGNITNTCKSSLSNACAYGIIYRVTWEYEV